MNDRIKINNLYNEAVEYINNNNISVGIISLEQYVKTNKLDSDALNLLGICYFIKCKFNEAYKCFVKSNTIEKDNEISIKYINYLKSKEFNGILDLYNMGIENIQKENINESKIVFEKVLSLEPSLIEPKIILTIIYIYEKNMDKANKLIEEVFEIDSKNQYALLIKSIIKNNDKKSKNKIYKYLISSAAGIVIAQGIYMYTTNNKIKEEYNNKIEILTEENNLLKIKESEEQEEIIVESNTTIIDEKEVFNKSIRYLNNKDYKKAINSFNNLIKYGKESTYVEEATYWIASSYEALNDYNNSILYYNMYIDNYSKSNSYYDDSLYKLGLVYYSIDDIVNSKKIMSKLAEECTESIYNNSKVKEIMNY